MDFNELIVRFMSAIARRRLLFFLVCIVVLAGVVLGVYARPQKYQSMAKIMVTLQAPQVNTSRSEELRIMALRQPEEVLAAQAEIFQTRELTEELVDRLPESVFVSPPSGKWYVRLILAPLKEAMARVRAVLERLRLVEPHNERFARISMIEKNLRVIPIRKSAIIELVFTAKNPEVPPLILQTLIELYQDRVAKMQAGSEGLEIYTARAAQLNTELEAAERALAAFKLQNGIVDLEAERAQLLAQEQVLRRKADRDRLNRLTELQPEHDLLTRRVDYLRETYAIYRKIAADRSAFIERDTRLLTQVIDPPQAVYMPLKPSRLVLVVLGLFLAMFVAILVVVLVEWIAQIRQVYTESNDLLVFRRSDTLLLRNPTGVPEAGE